MLDSNILFSAFYLQSSEIAEMVKFIKNNHTIVLCECIIKDTKYNFHKKYPDKFNKLEEYLKYVYDEIFIIDNFNVDNYPKIRDIDDIEILAAAIEADVDLLITGDNDFYEIKILKPRILKPRQFIDEFINKL